VSLFFLIQYLEKQRRRVFSVFGFGFRREVGGGGGGGVLINIQRASESKPKSDRRPTPAISRSRSVASQVERGIKTRGRHSAS
jgi:hypothetical protein